MLFDLLREAQDRRDCGVALTLKRFVFLPPKSILLEVIRNFVIYLKPLYPLIRFLPSSCFMH